MSVIFWGLMIVVTLKYVMLILRADNRGEGGIMALTALAAKAAGTTPRRRTSLLLVGVFGAALFYGDSVITPAISVLGAVEGLEVVTPALKPYVVPMSVARADRPVRRAALRHRRGRASCSGRSSCCGSSCWPSPASSRSCSSRPSWRR